MHDGKTDLVTRAASDIEAESFRLLKAKGAAVIGIDRTEEDMKVMVRPGMQWDVAPLGSIALSAHTKWFRGAKLTADGDMSSHILTNIHHF